MRAGAEEIVEKIKAIITPKVGLGVATDLEADPKELVKTVLERAAAQQAVDASSVALVYEGTTLDEKRRLKSYGIRDGATLELIPKHDTGGYEPPYLSFRNLPMDFNSRLAYETKLIRAKGIPLKPIDPRHWIAIIRGRGKWNGNNYIVNITVPYDYPFSPPDVQWQTPLRPTHPNITFPGGFVCLSILDKDWTPEFTLQTVHNSLGKLLEKPNHELFSRAVYAIRNLAGDRR